LGFFVRLIPEVLAYPYPIGYDSVYYVFRVQSGVIWGHWSSVFSSWLLYALTVPFFTVTHLNPFLIVKLAGPILYGLSACGVYWFSSKGLKWDLQKSLIAATFFVFQLAAFRISWDLLRNMLGIAILLFALPFIIRLKSWKDFMWFAFLSVLVVFSHELASAVMFVLILGVLLKDLIVRNTTRLLKVLAAVSPSLVFFLVRIYLRLFPIQVGGESNVISAIQPVGSLGGLFFLANYFVGSGSGSYSGYLDLFAQVLSVFILLFLLCLPLVLVGFFRDRVLDTWTLFVVGASFSCLVVPFFAFNWWDRWMFLLVFPFTFYAVNGLVKVFRSVKGIRPSVGWLRWMNVTRKKVVVLLFSMVLLTSLYIGVTLQNDNYGVFSVPTVSRYFSVAPTVPLRDVKGTMDVMEWINENGEEGSCVLVYTAFLFWARLYLNDNNNIVLYSSDIDGALDVAASHGFYPEFLVWWGENIGWYWFTVPDSFESVFQSGRMAVFQYQGLNV
jgi:hypothetical protein